MIDRKFIPKIALGDNQPLSNVSGCQFSEWRNSPCGCVSPWCPQYSSPYRSIQNQWIGLRENLQETMFLPLNMGFSCKISPKPIQWQNCSLDPKKNGHIPNQTWFFPRCSPWTPQPFGLLGYRQGAVWDEVSRRLAPLLVQAETGGIGKFLEDLDTGWGPPVMFVGL